MSVKRRVNWLSQQRVDTPDMRSVESAASNDFDELIQSVLTGTGNGYIMRGFNISMAGAIGGAASGLQLISDPGAVLHVNSSQSGTFYLVPSGTAPQQLNSATNTIVDGAFAPSAINYVGLDYERYLDDSTSSQTYLWNPTTNNETTKTAPRAQVLRYRLKISTSIPGSNVLPIATVVTDAGNNVISVTDARPLFGRLGRGGFSANPFYSYSWSQGRTENSSTSSSNALDPFSGGDKAIGSLKDLLDALMSSIQEIKGTTYWYSQSSSGSLEILREDLGNTTITGRGHIAHSSTTAGLINWDQDILVRVVGSRLAYKLVANPTANDITLGDDQVAYVTLVRGVIVSPNLVFTNSSPIISSVGAISWTGPLQAGDWIKLGSDTDAGYYQILSVDSLTQVTLTEPYLGSSTGVVGAKAKYAFGSYTTSPTPSTNRNIYVSARKSVPAGQDVFWLFMRNDNAGILPRVYVRFLGSELQQGDTRDVSDEIPLQLLKYIGSPIESASLPQYSSAITAGAVAQVVDFTFGAASTISAGQYFYMNSSGNARDYYVWFKKDGVGTDPMPPGVNASIIVNISTGMTAVQVANAFANALNNATFPDFSAVQKVSPNDYQVRVTNTSGGSCVAPVNYNVGAPFAVTIITNGTGNGNFIVNDGDSLTVAMKRLDQAYGLITAALNSPTYDQQIDVVASGALLPTSINGPVTGGTILTLPNNSRLGGQAQRYTVGNGVLQVYLNGQYLRLGLDWVEVGQSSTSSNQFQIQQNLAIGDTITVRLASVGGSGGGSGGGGVGPQGNPGPQGPPGANAVGGPVAISTKTSSYTVALSDNVLLADCTSGAITFTLPAASSATGRIFFIKKKDSSVNAMIIKANGTEVIDGVNQKTSITQYESFTLMCDGTSWFLF